MLWWILGQSDAVKENVTSYFKDPGAFSFITGKRTSPVDLKLYATGTGDAEVKKKNEFYFMAPQEYWDSLAASKGMKTSKLMDSLKIQKALLDSVEAAKRVDKVGKELEKSLKAEMITRPELKDILSSIKIEMTNEGLRIELIESKDALFF